jgi:hypothetical protein
MFLVLAKTFLAAYRPSVLKVRGVNSMQESFARRSVPSPCMSGNLTCSLALVFPQTIETVMNVYLNHGQGGANTEG